ncbi:DUF7504 family protein [Haloprofundus salilacus]|uniref:DUF7504 family protein n=1 Tax=Haloprofundus salilacus TaxID=2876190 RepID=UPI001CCF942C|nr:hypothetical protein [Haloprofundus salilacus]
MRVEGRSRGEEAVDPLRGELMRLKERGCNLLVTGAVSESVTARATQRLLGSPVEERKRLVTLTDTPTSAVDSRLPIGVSADDADVRVIERQRVERSAAEAVERGDGGGDAELRRLEGEISRAIASLDDGSGFGPAELRLSVDSIGALLETYDAHRIREFLQRVCDTVEDSNGMGHYHLPLSDDSRRVQQLESVFDARIELRQREPFGPEQRWHVPGYGTTGWIQI